MVLYATLAVCALLAAAIVYRYDLHDREPWYMLLAATLLGAAGMYLAGRAQVWALSMGGSTVASNWNLSISLAAGLSEEVAKLAVVVLIAAVLPRMFNDPMDGLVYGSFAGLGAALEETFTILGPVGAWQPLPPQEVIRITGHLVMGGIGGFGIGAIRPACRTHWAWLALASFFAAVTLHVLWDIIAFSANDAGRMKPWHTAASVSLMLAGLAIYWSFARVGERWSRAWFAARVHRSPGAAAPELL